MVINQPGNTLEQLSPVICDFAKSMQNLGDNVIRYLSLTIHVRDGTSRETPGYPWYQLANPGGSGHLQCLNLDIPIGITSFIAIVDRDQQGGQTLTASRPEKQQ